MFVENAGRYKLVYCRE